ncbi:MAG TPA: hypothetical protein PKY63_00785 [Bacteroidales bacterium]|nr:hypothetical protein [Bacteroidales bacterium]
MPKPDKTFISHIRQLSTAELQEIVLKLITKDKFAYDFVSSQYINKDFGETELFEKTKKELDLVFTKSHKGFSFQLQLANMLAECIRKINEFTKVSKNKVLEAELVLFVIEVPFSNPDKLLGTCFTTLDSKVAMLLNRLINLVTKKMHEDYRIEYVGKINRYLEILHSTSNHLDSVYKMPKKI